MGLSNSRDSVKISEKTGGAYADMSDVIDDELNDIFGSAWTQHSSHYDSRSTEDGQHASDKSKNENNKN
jgi:hypothetical protein